MKRDEEDIHAVVLALDIFGAEHYDQGPTDAEACNGTNNGRGCLNLNGGIIQKQRGAVGLTDGHGYIKRYQYNTCAVNDPPPYFPTTGGSRGTGSTSSTHGISTSRPGSRRTRTTDGMQASSTPANRATSPGCSFYEIAQPPHEAAARRRIKGPSGRPPSTGGHN